MRASDSGIVNTAARLPDDVDAGVGTAGKRSSMSCAAALDSEPGV